MPLWLDPNTDDVPPNPEEDDEGAPNPVGLMVAAPKLEDPKTEVEEDEADAELLPNTKPCPMAAPLCPEPNDDGFTHDWPDLNKSRNNLKRNHSKRNNF